MGNPLAKYMTNQQPANPLAKYMVQETQTPTLPKMEIPQVPRKRGIFEEGIVQPAKSFYGGTLKASASAADKIDKLANQMADYAIQDKFLSKTMVIPTILGKIKEHGGLKNTALKYLRDNWNTEGDRLIKEGLTPGFIQKVYTGLGMAAEQVPEIMATGGLTTHGALSGAAEGGVPGAITGAAEGKLMSGIFKGAQTLPTIPKKAALFATGAATTPGGVEDRIAGGTTLAALPSGSSPSMEQFKTTQQRGREIIKGEKTAKQIENATQTYRSILRPDKSDIRAIEVRKRQNLDDYYKLAAQEGLPIETSQDGKLDTQKARDTLTPKQEALEDYLTKRLRFDPEKRFDLYRIGEEVKTELRKSIKNDTEYKSAAKDVDLYIKDAISVRGRMVNGEELNNFKRGMWSVSYVREKPVTSGTVPRKIGFVAKEAIEKGYPDVEVKKLNEQAGRYSTLRHLLENAHGRVISGGKIGKYAAQTTGAIVGALAAGPLPYIGPIAGGFAGRAIAGKLYEKATSPERRSASATKKAQGVGLVSEPIPTMAEPSPIPTAAQPITKAKPVKENPAKIADDIITRYFIRGVRETGSVSPEDMTKLYNAYKKATKNNITLEEFAKKDLTQINNEVLKKKSVNSAAPTAKGGEIAYGMQHRPTEGPPAHDLLAKVDGNNFAPKDIYEHPEWYANGDKGLADRQSISAIQRLRGKSPDSIVTVYRGTPKNELNSGDWVSFSKDYAKNEAEGKNGRVFSFKVKVSDVKWAGDSLNEFGYFGKGVKQNTEQMIASLEKEGVYIQKKGAIPPNADMEGFKESGLSGKYGTTARNQASAYYEYIDNQINELRASKLSPKEGEQPIPTKARSK